MNKEYLGDSVYAEINDNGFDFVITLTTENGNGPPSNTIYLELNVLLALASYYERATGKRLR